MRRPFEFVGAITATLVAIAFGGYVVLTPAASHATTTSYRHLIVIPEENHGYNQVIGSSAMPFLNGLAQTYGLATNYTAGDPTSYHSLPSYLMMTAGTTGVGVNGSDCSPTDCPQPEDNIFHQLDSAGLSWKGYAESMPSNCDTTAVTGDYAVRHAPAPYFTDLTSCATNDVPLGDTGSGALSSDLAAGQLPNYSFVTPNLQNDMHNGSPVQADNWLATWIPKIMSSPNYQSGDTAIVITTDEGSGDNQVATVVVSPTTLGVQDPTPYTHYSLLRTAEDLFGLPALGGAATATSMISGMHLGGAAPPPPSPSPSPSASPSGTPSPSDSPSVTPSPSDSPSVSPSPSDSGSPDQQLVQENADAIKWTGQWRRIGPDNAYSERFAAESTQPDSTATLRFTGDQISWVSATGPDGGKAVVYLDDQEQARVDLHSGDRHDQVTVWDSPALSSGQHTLVIRAVGDGHVVLDVLVVTGS